MQIRGAGNKNDTDKNWVNGTVGIVDRIESEFTYVKKLPSEEIVCVERETWEDKKYDVELNQIYNIEKDIFEEKEKIIETITGQFKQFPLQLGYAMTIHKAQGSEFDVVILVVPPSSNMLLTRTLLYTGITRAKKLLIVIGNKNLIEFMINNCDTKKRNTGLKIKFEN